MIVGSTQASWVAAEGPFEVMGYKMASSISLQSPKGGSCLMMKLPDDIGLVVLAFARLTDGSGLQIAK